VTLLPMVRKFKVSDGNGNQHRGGRFRDFTFNDPKSNEY
jgi:hypothetical protein